MTYVCPDMGFLSILSYFACNSSVIVGMSSCICAIVPGIALLLGSKTPGFLT